MIQKIARRIAIFFLTMILTLITLLLLLEFLTRWTAGDLYL